MFETVNIAWPRALTGTWYLDWGLLIMTGVPGVTGFGISAWVLRPGAPGTLAAVEAPALEPE